MIHLEKAPSGKLRQQISIGNHQLFADVSTDIGGDSSAPAPHDLFDSALAACKAITVSMYAQRKGIPLDGIKLDIERDDSKEKTGEYTLKVTLHLEGELTDAQRQSLLAVADKCPVHKLMSQATIHIDTQLAD